MLELTTRSVCSSRELATAVLATAVPSALNLRSAVPSLRPHRLGALSGILATVTFPPLHRCLGLVATGSLSIWLQLACLLAGVAPALAAALGAAVGAAPRMYGLVWGLVLSRFGLWSFDLAGEWKPGGAGCSCAVASQAATCAAHVGCRLASSLGSAVHMGQRRAGACLAQLFTRQNQPVPSPGSTTDQPSPLLLPCAANQLIQETVEHSALGAVSGVQGSLQSLFQVPGHEGSTQQGWSAEFRARCRGLWPCVVNTLHAQPQRSTGMQACGVHLTLRPPAVAPVADAGIRSRRACPRHRELCMADGRLVLRGVCRSGAVHRIRAAGTLWSRHARCTAAGVTAALGSTASIDRPHLLGTQFASPSNPHLCTASTARN